MIQSALPQAMDLIETNSNYIFLAGTKALFCDRLTGKFSVKNSSEVAKEWNPVCLGKVDGIIGKLRYYPESCWRLFVIRASNLVGHLPDGLPVRRITQIFTLQLSTAPTGDLQLDPCELYHPEIRKLRRSTRDSPVSADLETSELSFGDASISKRKDTTALSPDETLARPKYLIRRVRRRLHGAVTDSQSDHRKRDRYEQQIHEELVRMFDTSTDEGCYFYFSPGGGDLTSWTQRKSAGRSYWTGIDNEVDDTVSKGSPLVGDYGCQFTVWRQPVWRRADQTFFWNVHMLCEAIEDADKQLKNLGLPDYASEEAGSMLASQDTGHVNQIVRDMEPFITPIVHGFIEFEKCQLHELTDSLEPTGAAKQRQLTSTYPLTDKNDSTLSHNSNQNLSSLVVSYTTGTSQQTVNNNEFGLVTIHGLSDDGTHQKMDYTFDVNNSESFQPTNCRDENLRSTCLQADTIAKPVSSSELSHEDTTSKADVLDKSITLIIFSRRSRFRAGTRYRRRGVDENGYTANYVETEQIVHMQTGDDAPQTVAFLQSRGSVPLFWTQSGLKYKPPINLDRDEEENKTVFRLHWKQLLSKFQKVVIVNLLDSGPKRSENRLSLAYTRHLMCYNQPQLVTILFDFHDYCRGLHFENASILLLHTMHLLREMSFNWTRGDTVLSNQRWIFRHNCLDCLDRTNLVQCMFASAVVAIQLKKFAIIDPEDSLPQRITRVIQHMWANNGDALSQQYTGTVALKTDFTRTGERTMNGLMRDGVSSMNRYYLRFREMVRQAAIDLMLGDEQSLELTLLRSGAGVESASLQARQDRINTLISRCKQMVLTKQEISLSDCLLTYYSELTSDVQFPNVLVLATDRFLHFIRIDSPKKLGEPVYVRLPVDALIKLELGLEPAVFRAHRYVLRVYYRSPTDDQLGDRVSSDITSEESAASAVGTDLVSQYDSTSNVMLPGGSYQPTTVTDHTSSLNHPPHSMVSNSPSEVRPTTVQSSWKVKPTGSIPCRKVLMPKKIASKQYFFTFMQPSVRLFNTILVPVPPGDEVLQSLRVVAAMLMASIKLNDGDAELTELPFGCKLERLRQSSVPKIYQPSDLLDVDRLFEGLRPTKFTRQRGNSDTHRKEESSAPPKSRKGKIAQLATRANRLHEHLTRMKINQPILNLRKRNNYRPKSCEVVIAASDVNIESSPHASKDDNSFDGSSNKIDVAEDDLKDSDSEDFMRSIKGGTYNLEDSETSDLSDDEGEGRAAEDEYGEQGPCRAPVDVSNSINELARLTQLAVECELALKRNNDNITGQNPSEISGLQMESAEPKSSIRNSVGSSSTTAEPGSEAVSVHQFDQVGDSNIDRIDDTRLIFNSHLSSSEATTNQSSLSKLVVKRSRKRSCCSNRASEHPDLPPIKLPGNPKLAMRLREKRFAFVTQFESMRKQILKGDPLQTTFIMF